MSSTSLKPSSLIYTRSPPIMDSTVKSTLIQGIQKLCAHTRGSRVEKSLGQLYLDVVGLMDRVEPSFIHQLYQDIKSGKVCSGNKHFLDLYLDAVSITSNPGAIKTMVSNIIEGNRELMYTWRLHTMPFVPKYAIPYLEPLFEKSTSRRAMIAAGTAINRYYTTEIFGNHLPTAPELERILGLVDEKLRSSCSSSGKSEIRKAIALLKMIGNVRHVSKKIVDTVETCLQSSSKSVKLEALEALRQIPCDAKVRNI